MRPEIVAKRNNPIVLDFLCLFFTRIFCTYTKHKKHNQAKVQNASKLTKIKNTLKKNSNLFAYLSFCCFCARKEKRIEKRKIKKQKSLHRVMY